MKIIITGGGTGGHFYPALAVAQELLKDKSVELLYVGERSGIEEKVIKDAHIDFKGITVKKYLRKKFIQFPFFLFYAFIGCFQSLFIILKFRPNVVAGFGGYVSAPVVLISSLLGVKTLIHEQNTVAGLANRKLAAFVSKICITFNESLKYFPAKKTMFTGNPVRQEVLEAKKEISIEKLGLDKDKLVILVFGGSRGAHKINITLASGLKYFRDKNLQILHITGRLDYDEVRAIILTQNFSGYKLYDYADNMWDFLVCADLVVSRAGATSIAEITDLGIPSILIPYPFAAENHQEINAKVLEKDQASIIISDKNMTSEILAENILHIIEDPVLLKKMAQASKNLGQPKAAQKISAAILGLEN